MFEKIARSLSGMVQIPTVSGAGNEALYEIGRYKEYLEKEFANLFGQAERTLIGEAVLLRIKESAPGEKLPVLFTGHMDVVPADEAAWKYPPFSGAIVDGSIWGRGTQDMKGPQCALLSAFDALLSEGWQPERDIWLYLSCDEEIGGPTTEKAAAWLKKMGIHFAMVFDEGGTICENFMGLIDGKAALFGISEKGSLEYRFTARSAGGHAANPQPHSAIVQLAELMHDVEAEDLFVRRLSDGNRAMLEAIAAYSEEEKASMLRTAACEEAPYETLYRLTKEARSLLGGTIAFTMIHGGIAVNIMPKEVQLTANVRVGSVEKEAEVTKKLLQLAKKHDVLCELVSGVDAAPESRMDTPEYLAMKRSVEKTYPGLPIIPFVLGGGTDSRHFLEVTDQVLRFSPMHAAPEQGRGVHGDNESAYIKDVENAARCYYELLKHRL